MSTVTAPQPRVDRRASAALIGVGAAAFLAVIWSLLPPTGTDLSAQFAHADFAAAHLWKPIDLQWFGGTNLLGYSIIVPPLMAVLGVRLVGALATVAAAGLLGLLMSRCRVPRPRAGAVAGALCLGANLVVGRLTFAVGVAAALATLIGLTMTHRSRWLLLVGGPILTWAASPLAALFLGLVGGTLVLRRHLREGVVLAGAATVALAASVWVGQGGYMPLPAWGVVLGVLACAVLAAATKYDLVRVAAILAAVGIVLAVTVHTQVGINALRLPALFAAPIVIATSRLRWRLLVPAVALTVCIVPPLRFDDVASIGAPADNRAYYSEIVTELTALPLTGRVEIPPTVHRWESVYVADDVPLARGWMTQLDAGYYPLFFDETIDAMTYHSWLRQNGVQYVAVADAQAAQAGQEEVDLINGGLPYLRELWHGEHWTVYAVANPTGTVAGAKLLSQDDVSVSFAVDQPREVLVRIRWSQWLTLSGPSGCLSPHGTWTRVLARQPGTYQVGSSYTPGDQHRTCRTP
jgi:hypothetical protein